MAALKKASPDQSKESIGSRMRWIINTHKQHMLIDTLAK